MRHSPLPRCSSSGVFWPRCRQHWPHSRQSWVPWSQIPPRVVTLTGVAQLLSLKRLTLTLTLTTKPYLNMKNNTMPNTKTKPKPNANPKPKPNPKHNCNLRLQGASSRLGEGLRGSTLEPGLESRPLPLCEGLCWAGLGLGLWRAWERPGLEMRGAGPHAPLLRAARRAAPGGVGSGGSPRWCG